MLVRASFPLSLFQGIWPINQMSDPKGQFKDPTTSFKPYGSTFMNKEFM